MPEASRYKYVCVCIHSELQLMNVICMHTFMYVTHKYEDSILSDSLHPVLTQTV